MKVKSRDDYSVQSLVHLSESGECSLTCRCTYVEINEGICQ